MPCAPSFPAGIPFLGHCDCTATNTIQPQLVIFRTQAYAYGGATEPVLTELISDLKNGLGGYTLAEVIAWAETAYPPVWDKFLNTRQNADVLVYATSGTGLDGLKHLTVPREGWQMGWNYDMVPANSESATPRWMSGYPNGLTIAAARAFFNPHGHAYCVVKRHADGTNASCVNHQAGENTWVEIADCGDLRAEFSNDFATYFLPAYPGTPKSISTQIWCEGAKFNLNDASCDWANRPACCQTGTPLLP